MAEKSFGLRLKWLGCACFEMDFGGVTIVNDPWITPNPNTELNWEAVEKCDYIVSVPLKGQMESLNASVAAAVLMFEKVRQESAKS